MLLLGFLKKWFVKFENTAHHKRPSFPNFQILKFSNYSIVPKIKQPNPCFLFEIVEEFIFKGEFLFADV